MTKIISIRDLQKMKSEEAMPYVSAMIYHFVESIENFEKIIELVNSHYPIYNKSTKVKLNELGDEIKLTFKDYRSYMIKTSKKVDLPNTIIEVYKRTIKSHEEFLIQLKEIKNDFDKLTLKKEKLALAQLLIKKIAPQKEDFILENGARDWENIICLIRDDYIQEKDLPSYGIDI